MKKWYQSKTVNTNLVAILGAISLFLQGSTSGQATISAIALSLINIGLRFVTNSGIGAEEVGTGAPPADQAKG